MKLKTLVRLFIYKPWSLPLGLLLCPARSFVIRSDKSLIPSRGKPYDNSERGGVISQRCMEAINRLTMTYPNGVYSHSGRRKGDATRYSLFLHKPREVNIL